MGYNQHQSFYLRDRWLGKGLRALQENERFFFLDDAFERLGLGKNMVQSLRHWLLATDCAIIDGVGKNRIMKLTSFGKWLLENDPALKYMDTIAILHYNIVSEVEPSSSWYWYFNLNNEIISDKEDLFIRLSQWVQERETRVVSENSIQRDVDVLLNMYSTDDRLDDPEEVIFSPLSRLKLVEQNEDMWKKKEVSITEESLFYIKYSLCKYSNKYKRYEISLNELVNGKELLGKVFNMKNATILNNLIRLENDPYYKVNFTRTNNLDYLILPNISLEDLLRQHTY